MSVSPSYPGVYIEEVPSGVRTITGVGTSITAFIGRASRGPVNEPTIVNSFGDYERLFGGLAVDSTMSYAVRDFYLNGGSQAAIVRVHNDATAATISLPTKSTTGSTTTESTNTVDSLQLIAASVGGWGNKLQASVSHETRDKANESLFNLTVQEEREGGAIEKFPNVSTNPDDPRYLPRVLAQSSLLVRVQQEKGNWVMPAQRPLETTVAVTAEGGSDGNPVTGNQLEGKESKKTGLYALEKADLFNLLCIPPPTRQSNTPPDVYQAAMQYCVKRRAMLIVDPPVEWGASPATAAEKAIEGLDKMGMYGTAARNAALYFPRVYQPDPLWEGQLDLFVPCGIVAGVMARTDAERGVWKAPAGLDSALNGIHSLQVNLTNEENGQLNPLGINCMRSFPVNGRVVWGARTLRGADQMADEYKYIPVRRLALFIEESLYRGTQWVVFEPNDEPLWAQIRLNVGAFMHTLFRQGAFQGKSPRAAYFVKCDKETTTLTDINLGIVNILVGFAPLKPAEFVIVKLQQIAGQVQA